MQKIEEQSGPMRAVSSFGIEEMVRNGIQPVVVGVVSELEVFVSADLPGGYAQAHLRVDWARLQEARAAGQPWAAPAGLPPLSKPSSL